MRACVWVPRRVGECIACARVMLLIRHAKRKHHIILRFLASLAPPYFWHYLINGTIFGKAIGYKMCVFSLQLLLEAFLILRRIQPDIVINIKSLHVKYALFLSSFN